MRIYLIGPVGVGKSYIIEELDKLGYKVFKDPIIDDNLLAKGTPYEIQIAIESSFLQREIAQKSGIFDTSLETTQFYTYMQWIEGSITNEEYQKLQTLETMYMNLLLNSKNHYIFIRRDPEEIKMQIKKRGRPYEQNNSFYDKINNLLLSNFNESNKYLDIIELKGDDISPVINRIKELINEDINMWT